MSSIYIHLPFCTHKCPFCDFAAFQGVQHFEDEYIEVLIKEIEFKIKDSKPKISSIFFGGGTPSLTKISNFYKIFEKLRRLIVFEPDIEISLETTPHSVDLEYFIELSNLGINRISLGAQTFNNSELKAIDRDHSVNDIYQALEILSKTTINNVNIDLMYGLPTQTVNSFIQSFAEFLAISQKYAIVKHFSLYALTLEHNSPFYKLHPADSINYPKDEEAIEMYNYAVLNCDKFGFNQYEISNFAKPNYQSRHNIGYWKLLPFYGFGVGSYQFWDNFRSSNWKELNRYLKNYEENSHIEFIDKQTKLKEFIMLGLRLNSGIYFKDFISMFNFNFETVFLDQLRHLSNLGLINWSKESVSLTLKGRAISNSVIAEFF